MQDYIRHFLHDERPLLIRDSVHNYITLTPLEKNLVDAQIFQRLRYISQNSTVFYTYPSNYSNRFQHSIGAAHLAGLFIFSALNFSEENYLTLFRRDFGNLIDSICNEKRIDYQKYIHHYKLKDYDPIIWLVTRLVLLLHDLGHLPFSHLTEEVVFIHDDFLIGSDVKLNDEWDLYKTNYSMKCHEIATLFLLKHNQEIKDAFVDIENNPRMLFYELLMHCYDPKYSEMNSCLSIIKQLKDSELDADRADYVIRDGRNSGVEFGGYDISRMSGFLKIVHKNDNYLLLPYEHALSTLETFFFERYKLHKWVIFHHHVAQTDTALKHAIDVIVSLIKDGVGEIENRFDKSRLLYNNYVKLFYSDDVWMLNALRLVYSYVLNEKNDIRYIFLTKLLESCLFRKKFLPLWKSPVDYSSFSNTKFDPVFRQKIYERYNQSFKIGEIEAKEPRKEDWKYYNQHLALNLITRHYLKGEFKKTLELEDEINKSFEDYWIILEPKKFTPIKKSEARILTKDGQIVQLHELSKSISSLIDFWERDIHLFAFAVSLNSEIVKIDDARERFVNGFMRWYSKQKDLFPLEEKSESRNINVVKFEKT